MGLSPAASRSAFSCSPWAKRRPSTSFREAKSLAPSTVLMRKWRYSFLAGTPSMNTTMLATLSTPWVLEMS